jgi:hypothetical protein
LLEKVSPPRSLTFVELVYLRRPQRDELIDPGRLGVEEVGNPLLLIEGRKANAHITQIFGVEMRLSRSRLGKVNLVENRLAEQAIRNVSRMCV